MIINFVFPINITAKLKAFLVISPPTYHLWFKQLFVNNYVCEKIYATV